MSVLANGTTSTLELGSALVTAAPLSMACRVNPATVATQQSFVCISQKASASGDFFQLLVNATGGPIYRALAAGVAGAATGTNNTMQALRWNSLFGIERSSASRMLISNGQQFVTNTTSITPSGLNTTNVSARYVASVIAQWVNGLMADVAVWNADLSVSEAMAYAAGTPPDQIRPQNLILFLPLDRDIFDRSFRQNVFTNTACVINSGADPNTIRGGSARRKYFGASPTVPGLFGAAWGEASWGRRAWGLPPLVAGGVNTTTAVFRRTLSRVGTRVGSRQLHR